ncbi:mitochondrial fission ELM1 family protein [Methylobacterium sp. J-076]|uniref:mitochondrial fission ELM1 family protein n=1 Tax=Methylobacterium sp. J-076 TaxID=2836655 RepID=UPI001FB86538|nr:mitochondrial fission ELM1 family protein [Methylobacterium sp. J-076]MCJ2015806.1 mitochondrial fission ELM1 family protein [Methylobacterium sp. J-076]
MTGLAGLRAWIVTDGKAGDENQCLGVARCLGLEAEVRRVPTAGPFALLAPWGPADPRQGPRRRGSVLHGPLPALAIASGRRAVPYLRACRRLGVGFTAFLKDPRTGTGSADFIWVPEHDSLRGPNVLTTVTSPHLVSAARLAEARIAGDARLAGLPGKRVAVLLGGDSRHGRVSEPETARLIGHLRRLAASGCSLMVTTSRRTPETLRRAARAITEETGGFFWGGDGANPYLAMLAAAEAIVVTSDSVNMVSEAVATGAPVLLCDIAGTPPRHGRMYAALKRAGALASFDGSLADLRYSPIDATPVIAQALADAYINHRRGRV